MTVGPRVAVVGAGIAGLSAAYDLTRAGIDVVVIDPADRPGGKLRTSPFAGVDLDESADMFLARLPWGVGLCRDLGLEPALIHPAIGSALVVHDGRLRRLPEGLVLGVPSDLEALQASGLVSEAGLARLAEDLARPEGPPPEDRGEDCTVGELVRSRLGDEVFEVLVDPLLSGVNAGRADDLSAQLGAAQLLAAARRDRSLVRGARAQLPPVPPGGGRAPVFAALPGGMGTLVGALVEAIGIGRFRLGRTVTELIEQPDGRFVIATRTAPAAADPAYGPVADPVASSASGERAGSETVDAVVLATPGPVSAALLGDHMAKAATELGSLAYASVAIIALAWRAADVHGNLDASGFLVPRRSGLLLTACSWASAKFPHLGADGLVRLRASVGRSDDTRFLALADAELIGRVRAELAELMGIEAAPVAARVHRWLDALPQYRPGHGARIDAVEAELAERLPGVVLAGASLRGLGIPACIDSGRRAAQHLLERLLPTA